MKNQSTHFKYKSFANEMLRRFAFLVLAVALAAGVALDVTTKNTTASTNEDVLEALSTGENFVSLALEQIATRFITTVLVDSSRSPAMPLQVGMGPLFVFPADPCPGDYSQTSASIVETFSLIAGTSIIAADNAVDSNMSVVASGLSDATVRTLLSTVLSCSTPTQVAVQWSVSLSCGGAWPVVDLTGNFTVAANVGKPIVYGAQLTITGTSVLVPVAATGACGSDLSCDSANYPEWGQGLSGAVAEDVSQVANACLPASLRLCGSVSANVEFTSFTAQFSAAITHDDWGNPCVYF